MYVCTINRVIKTPATCWVQWNKAEIFSHRRSCKTRRRSEQASRLGAPSSAHLGLGGLNGLSRLPLIPVGGTGGGCTFGIWGPKAETGNVDLRRHEGNKLKALAASWVHYVAQMFPFTHTLLLLQAVGGWSERVEEPDPGTVYKVRST